MPVRRYTQGTIFPSDNRWINLHTLHAIDTLIIVHTSQDSITSNNIYIPHNNIIQYNFMHICTQYAPRERQ